MRRYRTLRVRKTSDRLLRHQNAERGPRICKHVLQKIEAPREKKSYPSRKEKRGSSPCLKTGVSQRKIFMLNLDENIRIMMGASEDAEEETRRIKEKNKLARLNNIRTQSFEFSVKGLDTLDKPELFILPPDNCKAFMRIRFLLNTLKRDEIQYEFFVSHKIGPCPSPLPIKREEALEILQKTLSDIEHQEILDDAMNDELWNLEFYDMQAIKSCMPNDTMKTLLKKALEIDSPRLRERMKTYGIPQESDFEQLKADGVDITKLHWR